MSLNDYVYKSTFFGVGEFNVRVQSFKVVNFNTGSTAFEYTFGDGQRTIKHKFTIWDKDRAPSRGLGYFVEFAKHCGATEGQLARVDEHDYNSMTNFAQSLVNLPVGIAVVKGAPNAEGKQYSEIDAYFPIEQPTGMPSRLPQAQQVPAAVGPGGWPVNPPPVLDEVPF